MTLLAALPGHASVLHQVSVAVLAGLHGIARLALLVVRAGAAVVLSRPGRLAVLMIVALVLLRRVRLRARARGRQRAEQRAAGRATRRKTLP